MNHSMNSPADTGLLISGLKAQVIELQALASHHAQRGLELGSTVQILSSELAEARQLIQTLNEAAALHAPLGCEDVAPIEEDTQANDGPGTVEGGG